MTATVGSEADEDLADLWLSTGGVPTSVRGETKSYPKRSELRRAEARASVRRNANSRPAGGRPSGALAGRQRPPAPASALRSAEASRRSTLQARFPIAVAPTPAVLPIPQTGAWRPAGIDVPMPRPVSVDAFHQPDRLPPMVPIAIPAPNRVAPPPAAPPELAAPTGFEVDPADWGLDLPGLATEPAPGRRKTAETTEPADLLQQPAESPRRLFGRGKSTAARLLVMALVVGAEGVAVTQLSGHASPIESADGAGTAAFELTPEAKQVRAAEQAEVVAQAAAAAADAKLMDAQKDASPAKAQAALAQAKAAATRIRVAEERRARAMRNAQRDPQSVAQLMIGDRGWSSSEFSCLVSLWNKESGWNYRATNPSSGAYGIPQSLPGSKMASAGSDWQTNPVTQIRWGLDYIASRYGTPCGAWGHSQSTGWY